LFEQALPGNLQFELPKNNFTLFKHKQCISGRTAADAIAALNQKFSAAWNCALHFCPHRQAWQKMAFLNNFWFMMAL
jgi:hypothetical protein